MRVVSIRVPHSLHLHDDFIASNTWHLIRPKS